MPNDWGLNRSALTQSALTPATEMAQIHVCKLSKSNKCKTKLLEIKLFGRFKPHIEGKWGPRPSGIELGASGFWRCRRMRITSEVSKTDLSQNHNSQ